MSGIKIRPAHLKDLDILLAFEQAIIEYERPMVTNMMTDKFHYYDLRELVISENAQVVVAEQNGQLIGSGYAKQERSRNYLINEFHSFLGFMYIAPEFRGMGINQLIIDNLIQWSKDRGLRVVCLTVFNENDSAVKAYQKLGFKKDIVEMRLALDDESC